MRIYKNIPSKLLQAIKKQRNAVFLLLAHFISTSPVLKHHAMALLRRFPHIFSRVRTLFRESTPDTVDLTSILGELPPQGQRLFNILKTARNNEEDS